MDRLTALRTFALVAEHQSFVAAARRMRVSPTAASRGIAELERELGVTLLRRTTRAVSLTQEGAAYVERCRRVLDDLDDADRSLRGENSEPRGTLLLTAPTVFGRMHILPVVTELLGRHPQLAVKLMLNDRIVRLVEEGIDVAVRIADLSDSALHAVRLAEVRRPLVASPAYLEARGEPRQVTDLHNHDLIVFGDAAPNGEWRFTAEGRPAIRCEPRLLTDSVEASVAAALAGAGIARVLSYQVANDVREGRLRYVLEAFEPPPLPVNLLFQANRRRTPNVGAFIAAALAHCRDRRFA